MEGTRENTLPETEKEFEGEEVKGLDHSKEFELERFVESSSTTGFQATHLAEAVEIIREMREEDAKIFLTFTSNIVSSGLRESVRYLAEEDLVDVIITSSGSLTEDVIKTVHPFKMGSWEADEAKLRERGVNRLGNIYVESDAYVKLERWLNDRFFPDFFEESKMRTPTEFAEGLGEKLEDDSSILYHAAENGIPVYCPALTDAEIGNFLFYYRQEQDPEVGVEILDDWDSLIKEAIEPEKTGIVCVGAGVPKHHAIMSNQFRGGTDYAVYISTGMEGDGSLSGAPPEEAISWGKIRDESTNYTEVEAEATLVLPLIVEAAFKNG